MDLLEGLNLTREVRSGIVCHTGPRKAATPEGRIIHFADRIAYINHDIDDAVRGGIIRESDIPAHLRTRLGASHGTRIDTLVTAMIDYGLQYCETTSTMSFLADSSSRKIRSNGTELTSDQSVLLQLFGMNSRRNTAIE